MCHLWFFISCLVLLSSLSVDAIITLDPSLVSEKKTELAGVGMLNGPEDVAYDSKLKLIYTGCADGWIKRVTVNDSAPDSVVTKWVNTDGRPLGIAFGNHHEVIVADPIKGLLNITRHGHMKVLTVGDKIQKFKLIDAVVVAKNGMVYFTEASYKYNIDDYLLDILEGRPHGRLWSYNPKSNRTRVLLRNLYFANGVALSPDQDFLIFCETTKNRCRKYYTQGDKKGLVENFVDLLGSPDNISSAGKDHYLITIVESDSDLTFGLRFGPKSSSTNTINFKVENGNSTGVFMVDSKGNVTAIYTGKELSLISSSIKVGNYIYCGSLFNLYMVRIDL